MKDSSPRFAADLDRMVADLERTLGPLFEAGRYRDFFAQAHAAREALKSSRVPADARSRLWDRLNRCVEAAKARQEREFAARHIANLTRWRGQIAIAERYVDALTREIDQLQQRTGPRDEQATWQRRIAEKQVRLADVRATIASLQQKIADVSRHSQR